MSGYVTQVSRKSGQVSTAKNTGSAWPLGSGPEEWTPFVDLGSLLIKANGCAVAVPLLRRMHM